MQPQRASFWLQHRSSNRLRRHKRRALRGCHPGGTINRLWNWIFGKWAKEKWLSSPWMILDRGSQSRTVARKLAVSRERRVAVSSLPIWRSGLVKVPFVTGSLRYRYPLIQTTFGLWLFLRDSRTLSYVFLFFCFYFGRGGELLALRLSFQPSQISGSILLVIYTRLRSS